MLTFKAHLKLLSLVVLLPLSVSPCLICFLMNFLRNFDGGAKEKTLKKFMVFFFPYGCKCIIYFTDSDILDLRLTEIVGLESCLCLKLSFVLMIKRK